MSLSGSCSTQAITREMARQMVERIIETAPLNCSQAPDEGEEGRVSRGIQARVPATAKLAKPKVHPNPIRLVVAYCA